MLSIEELPRNATDAAIAAFSAILEDQASFVSRAGNSITPNRLADFFWCLQIVDQALSQINNLYNMKLSTSAIRETLHEDGARNCMKDVADLLAEINGLKLSEHFIAEDKDHEVTFELDSGEVAEIFRLAGEMRTIVSESKKFDEAHKRRLMSRISKIEFEIHRSHGSFDVILAGITEFGETLGKFGKDVKPLVDRMKEIRQITQAKTKNYPEIAPPEDNKRLPPPDEESE